MSTLGLALFGAWWLGSVVSGRRRVAELPLLAPSGAEPRDDVVWLTAKGVVVDDVERDLAAAWMAQEGLDALDLVPGSLDALRLLDLIEGGSPTELRSKPFARAPSAGHAVVASRDVVDRAGLIALAQPDRELSAGELVEAFARLKRCAARTTDRVVVPRLRAIPEEPDDRPRLLTVRDRGGRAFMLWLRAALLLWLLWFALVGVSGWFALLLLLALAIRPRVIVAGSAVPGPLGAPLGGVGALATLPLIGRRWVEGLAADPRRAELVAELRPVYDALFADGVDQYFSPRFTRCPHCGDEGLAVQLVAPDRHHEKPGRFRLDRCTRCSLIFQNPQLTPEGLSVYYRDFYSGLDGGYLEDAFDGMVRHYVRRADSIPATEDPERWLDVGCGYGHLCCMARDRWPTTRFEGLDFGESVLEAKARGWIDEAWEGLLVERADELEGQFDVVSMSHYMEHTVAPRAEVKAAHTVLRPGGWLLVEVPDPELPLGALLGSYWNPWLQPQHLNFLPIRAMKELFEEQGFDVVVEQRKEPHQGVDLLFALVFFLRQHFGVRDLPWLPPVRGSRRVVNYAVWIALAPLLIAFLMIEMLPGQGVSFTGSNAYCLVGQKRDRSRPADPTKPGAAARASDNWAP